MHGAKKAATPGERSSGAHPTIHAADYSSHTAQFLSAIASPDDVIEIRAFEADKYIRIASGYFNDRDMLLQAVADLEAQKPTGIFCTVNRVDRALLARANNRVVKARYTTADADITARAVLPIDVDSVRPSGISATDAELGAALEVADNIDRHFQRQQWPAPIFVCSGNGYHLYYRVDLPADESATDWVKRTLATLADKFDTDGAKVDRSVYNAARIMRLPGTTARKGDPLPDRPHRICKLMEKEYTPWDW